MCILFVKTVGSDEWITEFVCSQYDLASKLSSMMSVKGYKIGEIHIWHVQTEDIPAMTEFLTRKD